MKKLSLIASLLLLTAPVYGQTVQVVAQIDSVDVLQGCLRQIDVKVSQPEGMKARWLIEREDGKVEGVEIAPGVEVNSSSKVDTASLGNGRIELNRTIMVQPWDSGEVVIPGIALVAGTDTFRSKPIALKVYTADVDTMTTIHTWGPPVTIKKHFWDWVPDWLYDYWWAILIGLLVIAGGVVAYIINRKGGLKKVMKSEAKPLPPYERAMSELQVLKSRQLCEKGMEKEYYTDLTEILRQYLEGRFGINAMEMTSTQIKRAVNATLPVKEDSKLMNEVLEMADYVKFARMRPLPEDNVRAFNQAMNFVEHTKPVEQPAEEGGKK